MTTPNLLTRSTNLVDLRIKQDVNVTGYRVRGHKTLNAAFAGSTAMFTVDRGRHYLSPTLRRNKTGVVADTKRGTTRITFDPDDFGPLSPNFPTDNEMLYLRVEDFSVALGAYLPPGQILLIPPAIHFGIANSAITVSGTAPANLGAIQGEKAPPGSMSFGLPLYSPIGSIQNLNGPDNLLVSFREGMPMDSIAPGGTLLIPRGSIVEVLVASQGVNPVNFSMIFTLTRHD